MGHGDLLISSLDSSVFSGLVSEPRFLAMQNKASSGCDAFAHVLQNQITAKFKGNAGQPITTVIEVLTLSPTALMHILDPCLTIVECKRLITRIHEILAVKPVTALDVMQKINPRGINPPNCKVSTGLPTLDRQLRGGFSVCTLTEIVGKAGAGKTHLSQQLVSEAGTSGWGSIYIDTENKMSIKRMKEIASATANRKRRRIEEHAAQEKNTADLVLENVTVHKPFTTRELIDSLDQLDEEIKQRNSEGSQRLPVRLLIVDSIAAPLRRDYSSPKTTMQRASTIFEIACKLKKLADNFHLAVVAINQVGRGVVGPENNQRNYTLDINDGEYTGSLGTVWQHCVSTRVVLEHDDDIWNVRRGAITKSIISKKAQFNFEMTQQGVREVP